MQSLVKLSQKELNKTTSLPNYYPRGELEDRAECPGAAAACQHDDPCAPGRDALNGHPSAAGSSGQLASPGRLVAPARLRHSRQAWLFWKANLHPALQRCPPRSRAVPTRNATRKSYSQDAAALRSALGAPYPRSGWERQHFRWINKKDYTNVRVICTAVLYFAETSGFPVK